MTSKHPLGSIDPSRPPYNGDPTGERDSTEALQAAFDEAARTGRTVRMAGTWKTTRPLELPSETPPGL
jgi:polygalacturonase